MDTTHPAGQLRDLSADDCWTLAATQDVGRIAWTGRDGITVIPVNFTVDGSAVHLRTAAYSALARECDDSLVSFQVDDIDPTTHSGWSVLFRGRAYIEYRGLGTDHPPEVWAAGARRLDISVAVDQVSGRRLHGDG